MSNLEQMEPLSTSTTRFDKKHFDRVMEARAKLPWHNKEYIDMYFESNHKMLFIKRN